MIDWTRVQGPGLRLGWRTSLLVLAFLTITVGLLPPTQGAWAASATGSGETDLDYNTATNWAGPPASIPGAGAAETATFIDLGVGNVRTGAATPNAMGFLFSNTTGNNYTITAAAGPLVQGLTDVTTTGTGDFTLIAPGTSSCTLAANNNAAQGAGALALNGGTLLTTSGATRTLTNNITMAHAQTLSPALVFSTYLGGTAGSSPLTFAQNAACDVLGNIYVTGATQVSDLPVLNAYQPTPAPGSAMSAFVAKYNPAGQPLWCTYLGGNNQSMGLGVAAMPNGGVAVVGLTTSEASGSFPTRNAFQPHNKGQSDYFVTVFDAKGKLQYSTYLGGSGLEGGVAVQSGKIIFNDDSNCGNCVAVDANGLIYVGGMTTSGGSSPANKFPVTPNALQSNLAGSTNASLSILDPSKSGAASLVYSSYLGGDRDNQGHGVVVDPSGRSIAVGGFTTASNFPTTTNAYRRTAPSGGFSPNASNGFITQYQSSQPGSPSSTYTMSYSTYLGGDSKTARDDVYGMTMDPTGLIVATGRTQSQGFPMTQGGPTIFNRAPYLQMGVSGDEPYLVKINPALHGAASLVYATFLGGGSASGQWGNWCTSVAVDARGAVYVAGENDAQGAPYVPDDLTAPQTFPYTPNALLQAPQGSEDAMLMQSNPSGDSLDYSTYLGGTRSDRTYGLAVDPDGNVILTGLTFSSNFPAQNWPGNAGYQNAFVTKFSPLYTPSNLTIDHGDTYTMTGDIASDNEYIGQNGTGALIQGGFTNTVNNNLKLGQNAGASGAYNLRDGSLSVGGYEYVGNSGSGAFTQTGGTHTVTGNLILAANAVSSGTYSLSGGSLTVGGYEAVGYSSTGSFNQSGGVHTVTALYLGADAGASGSYTLSDSGRSSLLSVAGNEYVGYSGTGSFTQSGGTHTVTGNLTLATTIGSRGTYNLQGGSLTAGTITVNPGGFFNQTGGTLTGAITVAGGTVAAGTDNGLGNQTLIINGGTLQAATDTTPNLCNPLSVGGDFNMGGAAGSTLELTSNIDLTGNLLNHNGVSNDTLSGNLSSTATGGITVTAGTLNLTGNNAAYAGTSTVTGGTLNMQGAGNYPGDNVVSGGTLNMNSAAAINYGSVGGANTITGGTVNMNAPLAFYLNDSTLTDSTLNLSAGAYKGGLTVGPSGIFNYTGGTFDPTGAANITTGAGSTTTIAPGLNMNIGAGILANNGTATVNGTLTGNLTNNAGGTVGGTGTITGALVNHGTVSPGNSPGTLTAATYTSLPGSTQVVEIATASNYDRIITTAAGGATLKGGTLSPQLLGGYFPATNTVFHVVETTGGGTVTGSFAGIDNTQVGGSRTLFWQALHTSTTADLQAVGNYTSPDLFLSANQRSAGNALNSLAPNTTGGDLLTVLDAINALTTNVGVAAAHTEISPAKYATLPAMTMPITHLQFQYLQNRLARVRWEAELGSEAVSASGFMRGFNFKYDSGARMMLAANNMSISDAGARYINRGVEQRWGIYLEPMANWGSLDATANLVGFHYKNFGFTLGAEYWVLDNLLVGVNTGCSRTIGSAGGSGGDLNANVIPFNAYGAFFHQGFYANAALGYTHSGYDMVRNIAFGTINRTAQASTSGNQFQLGAETGYDAKIGNTVVGPVLSLQYATQTVGGFTESNAGALALKVGNQTAASVQSGLGVRASYNAKMGNVAVKPHLSVTWQHEFSDNTRGLDASLAAGGSTINFQTDNLGQDFALISLDVLAKITRNLVANVGYTAEVGRDHSSNMGVNIGLKLTW